MFDISRYLLLEEDHIVEYFQNLLLLAANSLRAALAKEPLTLRRSETTEGVINLYVGTSFNSFSYVALSNKTKLFNLSRDFPFDHFFYSLK